MLLPLGDSPNLPATPWVTRGLIVVNVLVYLALLPASFRPPDPADPDLAQFVEVLRSEVGVDPSQVRLTAADVVHFRYGIKPAAFSLADAFTSMFLHGGLMHLFGNMLFLWIFGDNVEHRLGRGRFLLAYLATGIAAGLGDGLIRWGSMVPTVGASGAVSGVLGFYFAWFPANRVRVWLFLFPFFMNVVQLSARIVLGFYLLVDNLLPLILGASGGVSYGAHVGGFIAGWGAALAIGRGAPVPRAVEQEEDGRSLRQRSIGLPGSFRDALAAGRLDEAARLLFRLPRQRTRRALDEADKIGLGRALEQAGELPAALAAYQRALADHPAGDARAAAHLGAARILLAPGGSPTAAFQHLYAVLEEGGRPDEIAEARALIERLRAATRTLPSLPG